MTTGCERVNVPSVQATVSRWDEGRREASVVLDDGRELPVVAGAIEAAGLVRLRLGQRLSVDLAADGRRVDAVQMHG